MSVNLKRFLALVLAVVMLLPVFAGCANSGANSDGGEQTDTQPAPTEPAEEAKVLKVLTLGHSLTVDSCYMLNLVANAEGYEHMLIGTLYYSGCSLSRHVKYLTNDEPAYKLYISSTETPNMPPNGMEDMTMKDALVYEYWDIVVMQGGTFEVAEDDTYTSSNIQTIQSYVKENTVNPNVKFAWHMPWVFPVDRDLQLTQPEDSFHERYEAYNHDRSKLYGAMTKCVGDHIMTDDTFSLLIPSGTALENALSSYMTEKDLHRDYAHASDFGRLIAAYTWYCKLAGLEKLDAVHLDSVPKYFLRTHPLTQDWVLTDMEKAIILESVNNTLANPLEMTESQYKTAPAA